MATLAQGQAVKLHCAISQEITVTPSTGGRATISANGPGNVSYAQKTISAAETFGPYLSDTDVVIAAVAGSLSYDLGTASLVDGAGIPFLRGAVLSGEWMTPPSIFRLRLTGTGTVVMDARDSLGVETLAVASYSVSGATDQIEFPYAGDNAVAIRITLTGTAAAEVI